MATGRSWEDHNIGPDVANAGRLISDYIGRDSCATSSSDLDEAIEASRYSSHPYCTPPREWPPPVEIVNSSELPAILVERYHAAGGEGTALCGLFPEIHRAWATIDKSLFLWRYDKWDGQCPEYSGEEQSICAVGLAKAKPGIFVEAIQYLLVLATPVELVLLGVCCSSSDDGTDPYAELSLQQLPEYTVPTDGMSMTCVAGTDRGRIFLAGTDSHIYELQYTTGSGWSRCCRKTCVTGGFGNLISRWVLPNMLKFGAVDPVVDLAVDNERHLLYAKTQDSKIQLFDLGKNGEGPFKKIFEEKNLRDQRDGRYGSGRANIGRGGIRATKPSIVSMSTTCMMESKWLHLVASVSDGRRLYLTTYPNIASGASVGGINGVTNMNTRPTGLKLVATRPSPSIGLATGLAFGNLAVGSRSQHENLTMKIEAAHYCAGIFLLSDISGGSSSKLIVVNRDYTLPLMGPYSHTFGVAGAMGRCSRPLKEIVSSLPFDGRILCIADVLPSPRIAAAVQAIFLDQFDSTVAESSEITKAKKVWAQGELATQHLLPRRRAVVFGTSGFMEVVVNRPVDILYSLLDASAPRSALEDFFQRFGAGEAAAMCLLLAARLISNEEMIVSNTVAEKAADAFDDPRNVGLPQIQGSNPFGNPVNSGMGFNMGHVVADAQPTFSGAHEGLSLSTSRLLLPLWEFPVMVVKGEVGDDMEIDNGVFICRLPIEAMQILETKIRLLEQFLRSRRDQRRGIYGRVVGLGDMIGPFMNGLNENFGSFDQGGSRNVFSSYDRGGDQGSIQMASNKRQRVPYNPAELSAMEVRGMECIRRLLRRSAEALLLLQLLAQHHVARLSQSLSSELRRKLAQLTFHQLVCSEEGDQIATRLVSALVQYYIGPEGKGTVEDISIKLREGCPSYYNESDYKFFQAVECLEKAAISADSEEKEKLAKEALNILLKVSDAADLLAVCPRFEDLRFYEAVVELPLHRAKALDPGEDAFNDQIDPDRRQYAINLRERCYEVILNALRSLKSEPANGNDHRFMEPMRHTPTKYSLDQASRECYIRQIIQLGVRWPDRGFHEYLYHTLIVLGLENDLLELGGPDLIPFLQNACRDQPVPGSLIFRSGTSSLFTSTQTQQSTKLDKVKYLEMLARYYVHRRQHALAAQVLLRLAERKLGDGENWTLDQRQLYLSNAVVQARSATGSGSTIQPMSNASDNGLLELLEGKLAVLQFQIKIKEEFEKVASRNEPVNSDDALAEMDPSSRAIAADDSLAQVAREKALEISQELKSITQLYNNYAVPYEFWEICLEILHFSNYSGDQDSRIMRETWERLLNQALTRGGVAEACSVLKRVGSKLYPADGINMPLDTICFHLEKAALERSESGDEFIGDEDIARALLAACKGSAELVQHTYDRLLSSGITLPSAALRLRLLRSGLTVLREWTMSALAQRIGTTAIGASINLGGLVTFDQTAAISQGIKDKIISAATRYMTEVRRLSAPQHLIESIYRGFKELEDMLLSSATF